MCLDYEEMFCALNAYDIRYLVVGAHAVMFYTEPRYTKDIDIWIIPEMNDEGKVYAALKDFGAPIERARPADFANRRTVFQIGVAPVRIDIMMNVPGVSFEAAWRRRRRMLYGKAPINIIGLDDLISSKKKAGRPTG